VKLKAASPSAATRIAFTAVRNCVKCVAWIPTGDHVSATSELLVAVAENDDGVPKSVGHETLDARNGVGRDRESAIVR
jgi:hypothetical protein